MYLITLLYLVSFFLAKMGIVKTPRGSLLCGLAGYSTPREMKSSGPIKLAMIDNQDRGIHATGIASPWNPIFKKGDKAIKFLRDLDDDFFLHKQLITHTRHATMGAVNDDKLAHPFDIGNIVGCHNGWLINCAHRNEMDHVAETFGYNLKKIPIDSQLIFHHITKKSPKADMAATASAIADIEGCMAITWLDYRQIKKKGQGWVDPDEPYLCIYRRENKPLYIAPYKIANSTGIMYSSREEGLVLAGIDSKEIKEVEPNKIFRYLNGKLIDTTDVAEPQIDIELDESPSGFYKRFRENKKAYKDFYTIEVPEPKQIVSHSSNSKTLQLRASSSGGASPYKSLSPYSAFDAIGNYKGFFEGLEGLDYQNIKCESPFEQISEISHKESLVIATLKDVISKDTFLALSGWQIMIDGYPHTTAVTKDNGVAAVYVPKKLRGKPISLVVYPPTDYRVEKDGKKYGPKFFFTVGSGPITIEEGRVLEVTLHVPFLKTEAQAKKKNWIASVEAFKNTPTGQKNILDNTTHFTGDHQTQKYTQGTGDQGEVSETNSSIGKTVVIGDDGNIDDEIYADLERDFHRMHDDISYDDGPKDDDDGDIVDTIINADHTPDRRNVTPVFDYNSGLNKDIAERIHRDLEVLNEISTRGAEIEFTDSIDREAIEEQYKTMVHCITGFVQNWGHYMKINEMAEWTSPYFFQKNNMKSEKWSIYCQSWALRQAAWDTDDLLSSTTELIESYG